MISRPTLTSHGRKPPTPRITIPTRNVTLSGRPCSVRVATIIVTTQISSPAATWARFLIPAGCLCLSTECHLNLSICNAYITYCQA